MSLPYGLGLPIWAFPAWKGRLFTRGAQPADYLAQYSRVFSTVEGNTTFYQVPGPTTVERWRTITPPGFRFALKIPRAITHDRLLASDAIARTAAFFEVVAPLGDRLGPFLLQLPPAFGPAGLSDLDAFLTAFAGVDFAVEVRHAGYTRPPGFAALNDLLARRGVERAWMDTRALRAAPADDPESRKAIQRKPNLPVEPLRIGRQPFVRIVTHLEPAVTRPFLAQWAAVIARWLDEGCHPWIFVHSPGEHWAPEIARELHQRIQAHHPALPDLPAFAGEQEGTQLGLL